MSSDFGLVRSGLAGDNVAGKAMHLYHSGCAGLQSQLLLFNRDI